MAVLGRFVEVPSIGASHLCADCTHSVTTSSTTKRIVKGGKENSNGAMATSPGDHKYHSTTGVSIKTVALIAPDSLTDQTVCYCIGETAADEQNSITTSTLTVTDTEESFQTCYTTIGYAREAQADHDGDKQRFASSLLALFAEVGQKVRRLSKKRGGVAHAKGVVSSSMAEPLVTLEKPCKEVPNKDEKNFSPGERDSVKMRNTLQSRATSRELKTPGIHPPMSAVRPRSKVIQNNAQMAFVRRRSLQMDVSSTKPTTVESQPNARRASEPQIPVEDTTHSNLFHAISSLPDFQTTVEDVAGDSICDDSSEHEAAHPVLEVLGEEQEIEKVEVAQILYCEELAASTQLQKQSLRDFTPANKPSSTFIALRKMLPIFCRKSFHPTRLELGDSTADGLQRNTQLRSNYMPNKKRIAFSEKVTIAPTFSARFYDRSSPVSTRMSRFDHMVLYKDLMEFKINEMPVHFESVHSVNTHLARATGVEYDIMSEIVNNILGRQVNLPAIQ